MIKKFFIYKNIFSYFLSLLIIFVCFFSGINNYPGKTVLAETASASDATSTDATLSDAPQITSTGAIVMDIDTGSILYSKDAYTSYYPASITKVLTCLLALEQGKLTDTVTLSNDAVWGIERDSSHISLEVGEQISLEDALYAMMLKSANEAAWAVAEHVGGTLSDFCAMMNSRAIELGCVNSNFVNANGLPDDNHFTCAYDMALIGAAAYKLPEFRTIINSQSHKIPATNKNVARDLKQGNGMIFPDNKYYYEYCTGGKTGYTTAAHGTLISFAEKDGMRLVCVTLNGSPASESFYDTIKLFNYCFSNYSKVYPLSNFSFSGNNVNTSSEEESYILSNYYSGLTHNMPNYNFDSNFCITLKNTINIEDIQRDFTFYETAEDDIAGKISFSYNGDALGETNIYVADYMPKSIQAASDVINKPNVKPKFNKLYLIPIIGVILLVILFLYAKYIEKKRKKMHQKKRSRAKFYPARNNNLSNTQYHRGDKNERHKSRY